MHIKDAHAMSIDRVAQKTETDIENRLSQKQARKRRKQFGSNKLVGGEEDTYVLIFLRQLYSPLIGILVVAALGLYFLDDVKDAIIIMFVVVFNATIGTILEGRAQNVLSEFYIQIPLHFRHRYHPEGRPKDREW